MALMKLSLEDPLLRVLRISPEGFQRCTSSGRLQETCTKSSAKPWREAPCWAALLMWELNLLYFINYKTCFSVTLNVSCNCLDLQYTNNIGNWFFFRKLFMYIYLPQSRFRLIYYFWLCVRSPVPLTWNLWRSRSWLRVMLTQWLLSNRWCSQYMLLINTFEFNFVCLHVCDLSLTGGI